MVKKKSVSKNPQASGVANKIKQLHACIAKDQTELAKLYKKAVSEVEKKSAIIKKSLLKAKKSVSQASKNKKKSPQNHRVMTSLFQALKKGEALIKAEMEGIKMGYKQFVAQEKSRQQVGKLLAKTAKPASKTKRTGVKTARNRKSVRRTAEKTMIPALRTSSELYKISS